MAESHVLNSYLSQQRKKDACKKMVGIRNPMSLENFVW